MQTLTQEVQIVDALPPAADAAGRAAAYVSLKGYGRCFIVVKVAQGNAATVALTVTQAQDVSGTGAKAISNAVPIWANQDTASGDTLVRQTDAVSFTTSAATTNKIIVFQVDARYLDVNNNFRCVRVATGASNVANITEATYIMTDPRYGGTTMRSAIVN